MISEERLSEIIQDKGTVWCINQWQHPYCVQQVVFDGKREIDPHTFTIGWGAGNIFETEEEINEYLKYGNITRTEKLELPTWKEIQDIFNKQEIVNEFFYYAKHFFYPNLNTIDIDYSYSIYLTPDGLILIDDNNMAETLYAGNFTKENWDKARDICDASFFDDYETAQCYCPSDCKVVKVEIREVEDE